MKKALITGITGQDGSYLAEFLLEKEYEVHGTIFRKGDDAWRIENIKDKIKIYECDIRDEEKIFELIKSLVPDEIYHLAARPEPRIIFEEEKDILKTNFESVHFFLRAIKLYSGKSKFFFAGSSLMFGDVQESPQNESTPFRPNNPYGIAKTAGFHFVKMYRDAYGIFACTGILYNHESPRRYFNFLPRKITQAVAKIKFGKEEKLALGNLEAKRDWGFAGDYVEAMWLMLQAKQPTDYVIGTGKSHSVQEFVKIAFKLAELNWKDYVIIDKSFFRPSEACELLADTKKIESELQWKAKTNFYDLVRMMVEFDIKNI